MANQIKCPHCGNDFEPEVAFSHALEEQITKRLKNEQEAALKVMAQDALEEKERNKKLLRQLEDMNVEMRAMRRRDEERELEMKKKMADEEGKIRQETRKKTLEEHELRDREKENKLSDALKQIEELKSKIQQGSQQAQGETLELALEEILRSEFPMDIVEEVKKGVRGADILQKVIDKKGRDCGCILWESKNAQWSQGWIAKLKDDQRAAKANLAVLAVTNLPDKAKVFSYIDGVWVVDRKLVKDIALTLRYSLISLHFEKQIHENKNEKKEILWSYVTSLEFRQRIESVGEAFSTMQEEVEREKRWFATKWARQEKQLRRVIDSMHGMHGDLQGIVGSSLPEIKMLDENTLDHYDDK